jgi:hypothetical protein
VKKIFAPENVSRIVAVAAAVFPFPLALSRDVSILDDLVVATVSLRYNQSCSPSLAFMDEATGRSRMKWEGPIQVGNLPTDMALIPPETKGVYVISDERWTQAPGPEALVRYVGKAGNLRYRLTVLLGFGPSQLGKLRYFHSRSRRLFADNPPAGYGSSIVKTRNLFIGWRPLDGDECIDCVEARCSENLIQADLASQRYRDALAEDSQRPQPRSRIA